MTTKHALHRAVLMTLSGLAAWIACGGLAHAAAPESGVQRVPQVAVRLYSIEDGLDTYVLHGEGMGSGRRATIGLGCSVGERHFQIKVQMSTEGGKLAATVELEESFRGEHVRTASIDAHVSKLEAWEHEIGQDPETGRRYVLAILPNVLVEDKRPQAMGLERLGLARFAFDNSVVIVDDDIYLGKLSLGGGEVATIEAAMLGRLEFSLMPLRGAQILGTLDQGLLRIDLPDARVVEIHGVRNGEMDAPLPGGPFQVWVRWTPNEQPAEQWALERLAASRERSGLPATPEAITREWDSQTRARVRAGRLMISAVRNITDADRP
jgi:hypothetical protein